MAKTTDVKCKIVQAAPDDPIYSQGWTVSVGSFGGFRGSTTSIEPAESAEEAAQREAMELEEQCFLDARQTCPFCGTKDGVCDHLVATVDYSYDSVDAGFLFDNEELVQGAIQEAFFAAYISGGAFSVSGNSSELDSLWETAEVFASDSELEIDFRYYGLYRFIAKRLKAAGAVGTDHEATFGPGRSSELCHLFASNPEEVVNVYRTRLDAELEEWLAKCHRET